MGCIFFIVLLGILFSYTDRTFFESWYVREDGPVEWMTFVALVACCFVCHYRSWLLYSFRPLTFIICLNMAGLIFLFGAGEEISWGQRIFSREVPEFFSKYNSQQETNLHNLYYGDFKMNKIIFGLFLGCMMALYLVALPWFYHKFKKVTLWCDHLAVPIPRRFHVIGCLILFLLIQLTASVKKGELLEFANCWMIFILLLRPANREMFSRKILQH